jgi:hypothetical protein
MKWILIGSGALAALCLAVTVALGVAVWQGVSLAASAARIGIEHGRTALEQTLPPDAREQARARLDATVDALREGRFDAAVLSEAAWWLPNALADGQLDADEKRALLEKLDRLAPSLPADAESVRS